VETEREREIEFFSPSRDERKKESEFFRNATVIGEAQRQQGGGGGGGGGGAQTVKVYSRRRGDRQGLFKEERGPSGFVQGGEGKAHTTVVLGGWNVQGPC
jgi:hypothetical protein